MNEHFCSNRQLVLYPTDGPFAFPCSHKLADAKTRKVMARNEFRLQHYAGDVNYNVNGEWVCVCVLVFLFLCGLTSKPPFILRTFLFERTFGWSVQTLLLDFGMKVWVEWWTEVVFKIRVQCGWGWDYSITNVHQVLKFCTVNTKVRL